MFYIYISRLEWSLYWSPLVPWSPCDPYLCLGQFGALGACFFELFPEIDTVLIELGTSAHLYSYLRELCCLLISSPAGFVPSLPIP
jgi:hypothetical protein